MKQTKRTYKGQPVWDTQIQFGPNKGARLLMAGTTMLKPEDLDPLDPAVEAQEAAEAALDLLREAFDWLPDGSQAKGSLSIIVVGLENWTTSLK